MKMNINGALIVYTSADEILVCTPESEADLLRVWFCGGSREIETFARDVLSGPEAVLASQRSTRTRDLFPQSTVSQYWPD